MRACFSFFRIRFLAGLQYRSAAWAGIATQFVWGGMTLLLYAAFYKTGADAFPMIFPALASYIWLQQALLALFMTWYFDGEILDAVVTGAVAYELCRPADLYAMWFAKGLAVRTSRALLRFAPILLVAALLPPPFRLGPPASLPAALLFLLSTAMGLCVIVAFSMLIYISAFYTVSPLGVRMLAASVMEFFTGALLPLPFFPEALQPIFYALPFASMQSTPFLIYTGYMRGREALLGLLVQAVWLLLLVVLGRLWMRRAVHRTVVQGG